ncbi:MAG: hypothetical protein MUP63_03955 [Candidatus Nanohaloarchaeota archaeon QJJ-7]|nr:hypothetical protein [Candidatus Nanohaloarchaeota archaeon QJJ-7]
MKDQNVVEEDWDYLIVLDACRFDTFEEVYSDYFEGELEKRESRGSSTPEWAAKTFKGQHDLAYFSSNPFINGLGIPLNEMEWGSSYDSDWKSTEHISNIIDVWNIAWDDELDTVTPEDMNEVVLENRDEMEKSERTVIHYMQPHAPYIRRGKGRKVGRIRKSFKEVKEGGQTDGETLFSPVLDRIKPKVENFLEQSELAMKVGMVLELNPESIRDLGTQGTRETLEKYYEENLRLVMESVQGLVEELDGKVVITSDHGEAFGEEGVWEHHVETHIPALVEVPWFVVEEVKDS